MKLRSLQALCRISGVHFFDNESIIRICGIHTQFTDYYLLNRTGRVCRRASTGKRILVDGTISPNALISKIKDKLCPISEGGTIALLIDV